MPDSQEPRLAVCRIETRTGQAIIIYRDAGARYGFTCYTREDGHGIIDRDNYRLSTRPPLTFREIRDCDALIIYYNEQAATWGGRLLDIRDVLP